MGLGAVLSDEAELALERLGIDFKTSLRRPILMSRLLVSSITYNCAAISAT